MESVTMQRIDSKARIWQYVHDVSLDPEQVQGYAVSELQFALASRTELEVLTAVQLICVYENGDCQIGDDAGAGAGVGNVLAIGAGVPTGRVEGDWKEIGCASG